MPHSRIAVTGSTGLIGAALVRSLRTDGHEVVRLVRRPARSGDEVEWDPKRGHVDVAGLVGCDAVVHLAGAGVGDHRWTEAYKREIRDSRVLGTAAIADAVASLDVPPKVLLSGSAIGFYGDTGVRAVDEGAPPGDGFLPSVCVEWEEATAAAEEAGVRTVHARTGLVVAREGGAWGRLFPLFRAGLGGRMGNGRQYWSFIALHDHIAALRHILDTPELSGGESDRPLPRHQRRGDGGDGPGAAPADAVHRSRAGAADRARRLRRGRAGQSAGAAGAAAGLGVRLRLPRGRRRDPRGPALTRTPRPAPPPSDADSRATPCTGAPGRARLRAIPPHS